MDGSTMSTAHKTARAGPFLRGFTNSPWTGRSSNLSMGCGCKRTLTLCWRRVRRFAGLARSDECAYGIVHQPLDADQGVGPALGENGRRAAGRWVGRAIFLAFSHDRTSRGWRLRADPWDGLSLAPF